MAENYEYLEGAFIGTIMRNNKLIKETIIKSIHFTSQLHKSIYQIMEQLDSQGLAVDFITIATKVNTSDIGVGYLNQILSYANEQNFEKYEKAILSAYQKKLTTNVLMQSFENDWDLETIITKLSGIEMHREDDRKTAYQLATEKFKSLYEDSGQKTGVSTGLKNLDVIIGGLRKSELYIIAGRPSIGKTAFAINVALSAEKDEARVIFFSLEMSSEGITNRFLAHIGNYNLNKFKNPIEYFDKQDWDTVSMALDMLSKKNIVLYEKDGQTVAEMRAKIRHEIRGNPDQDIVVLIDYLQFIQSMDSRATTNDKVSQISRELKGIAKEFNIPVVCLSQLNRGVEQRQDKRPMMSDLRDSGSIEQDADVVILLYRDGYYYPDRDPKKRNFDILEVHIAKNRQGETSRIKAFYDLSRGYIRDVDNVEKN